MTLKEEIDAMIAKFQALLKANKIAEAAAVMYAPNVMLAMPNMELMTDHQGVCNDQ